MKTTTFRSRIWCVVLAGALATPAQLFAQAQPDTARTHVVRSGETLWSLAVAYLGDGRRWREIIELNSNIFTSADLLPVGATLRIPSRRVAAVRSPSVTSPTPAPAGPPRPQPTVRPESASTPTVRPESASTPTVRPESASTPTVRPESLGITVRLESAPPLMAQSALTADSLSADLPRVFLDCQANGCDTDFLRNELTWMNFVRDRTLARVHVLATSRGTSSGGTELTVTFIGLGDGQQQVDTIVQFSPQSATQAERRELLGRVIAQGMMRFVSGSVLASRLTIQYRAPAVGTASTDTRGETDRWNLWVFRVSGNAWFNGEEAYKSTSLNGSLRASRVTTQYKTVLSLNGNYNENHYTLSEGEQFASYRHGYSGEALFVKSIGDHWSFGAQANLASSVTSNLDLGLRLGPSIEYDVFPYSQSTRRQIVVRYGVGLKSLQYDSLTIFDELDETLPDHRLVIAAEATQPWGDIGGNATFSQYLHDPSLYQANVGVGVSWRVVRGLNLNFNLGYSKIRDQINLKRGDASDEDIFLRLRQLATGYSYYGSVGLSYTFGSIFQNVVNPRFTRNTGNWFF